MFRVAACLLFAVAVPMFSQHANTTLSNPFTSPDDVAAGGVTYLRRCPLCHGRDGTGASATDLTTGIFKRGGTDDAIFQVIAKGIPGTPMPAFDMNAKETWQVVAFIRSLGEGKAAGKAKGNAAHGAQVFRASGCIRCHTAGGDGGRMGPDLSQIGLMRSLGQLQSSVLRPGEVVSPEYWSLRGRTKSGQPVSGIRLNEDTYSYQILDGGGRLRSLQKDELAEAQLVRTSPMPAYEGKLKGTDFEDLIAFLASLRGTQGGAQ